MKTSDDTILDKLRRSLPGNTPKTGIRGNWFTGDECVRLLQMLNAPYESARRAMPEPVGCVTVGNGGLTFVINNPESLKPGEVLDIYARENKA